MVKIPEFIRRSKLYSWYGPGAIRARTKGTKAVFSDIYAQNSWGGAGGEAYSGSGSRGAVADDYVVAIRKFIADNDICHVVDFGCGDMHIGAQLMASCDHYTGVDIVDPLIESHRMKYGSDKADFVCLDIATDPLPTGDLCLVRQVFQHLSNAQIKSALAKMASNFDHIVVTEHYPSPEEFTSANVDKAPGETTRVPHGSAVVLDRSPFNLPCEEIFSLPAPKFGAHDDIYSRGFIRTFHARGSRK